MAWSESKLQAACRRTPYAIISSEPQAWMTNPILEDLASILRRASPSALDHRGHSRQTNEGSRIIRSVQRLAIRLTPFVCQDTSVR